MTINTADITALTILDRIADLTPKEVRMAKENIKGAREMLLVSDFDQTLSFNDSGIVLSEMLGIPGFEERVAGLAKIHLIQQGGELPYLLLHDPEFRRVRKEDLAAVGKRVRLKKNIGLLLKFLGLLDEYRFSFHVVSAAPEEVIQSALEGIVPVENIHGTQFRYDDVTGEIQSIVRVPAGYGKVAVVEDLRTKLALGHDCIVYVGDGSSDVNVMLHVNRLDGLTIAVSENPFITQIAKRTVLSDDALGVLVPILQDIVGWNSMQVRSFFNTEGFVLQDWDRVRTDWLTIRATTSAPAFAGGAQ
jgi:2-hydroxy-3-keto-5-methylthiopentenyl-1-phosphate phosphatase